MKKDALYDFSAKREYVLRNLFNQILDKNNINIEELSKKIKVSKSTLYELRDGGLEYTSLKCINSLSEFLKVDPLFFKYSLESITRHLSVYDGVTNATLYRLCELYMSGYKIIFDEFTSNKELKKVSVAGVAYKSRPAETIIIEDWNELKKAYLMSVFLEENYLYNSCLIDEIQKNDTSIDYKVLLFGICNVFFNPLDSTSAKMMKEPEFGAFKYFSNDTEKSTVNKNYKYELVFSNLEEMQRIKRTFDNIKGLDIKFIHIAVPNELTFDYITKNDYYDLDLFFQILSINYTYIRYGNINDNICIDDLLQIISLFFDNIRRATIKAVDKSDFIAPLDNYKDYYNHVCLSRIIDCISLSKDWKTIYIDKINALEPTFINFFFIYSILLSTLTYLDLKGANEILKMINVFLDYFKTSELKKFYINKITREGGNIIINPQSLTMRCNNEKQFLDKFVNPILLNKNKLSEKKIKSIINEALDVYLLSDGSNDVVIKY